MPTYLEPIGVPQWAQGERPRREQFNKAFEDLNKAYAGINTDALTRAESAAASAVQNAESSAASAREAREIAAATELQFQVDGDRFGIKRPADTEFEWTDHLTGPAGATGKPLRIAGRFNDADELTGAYPDGDGDNSYLVGQRIYIYAGGIWQETDIGGAAGTVNNQSPDARGNIELTAEHIPVEVAGMDAGTVQEAVRILKKDGDEVREYFTPEGAAKNANALNGVPGENYLPEKITDLAGAKSYEYAAPMACVARPSFIGRTVQEGTPGPDSPAPVKGVLNPWVKATAEDGTVVTKQLTGELFEGDSFDGVNLTANGTVSRHNLDLALSPGAYTIEAGDENGLLESVSIGVLPDSAVYGRRVYPYQHVKAGTVHKLTGTPGAEQIIFNATGAYQDGDTWTLNGAAVSVTYNDGQALLPTAVIAGDVVEAVIEGGVLRLMLQKPTPQPNILVNGLFGAKHLVNQRGQSEYTTDGYTIDMWYLWNSGKATLADNGITLFGADKNSTFYQLLPTVSRDEIVTLTAELDGKIYTVSGKPRDGLYQFNPNGNVGIYVHGGWNMVLVQVGITGGKSVLAASFKVEPGPRFTGWDEPKPSETLAECQRYLLRNSPGNTVEIRASYVYNGGINFIIPTPITMRKSPAISTALENSVIEVRNMSNATQSGFTFSTVALPGAIKITASKANHGLSDALLIMTNVLFTAEL